MVSNDEMVKIVEKSPEHFIGFASADPRNPDAKKELVRAFDELGLMGLKLNLSRLHMYPDDPALDPLYQVCEEKKKPIMFHAGYSWEPNTPAKYSEPVRFEDVAEKYPDLRFCLAHMGWPLVGGDHHDVNEVSQCVCGYLHGLYGLPEELVLPPVLREHEPELASDCFQDKVMFGSNNPRFRHVRSLEGIKNLPLRDDAMEAILGGNAVRFLGLEE